MADCGHPPFRCYSTEWQPGGRPSVNAALGHHCRSNHHRRQKRKRSLRIPTFSQAIALIKTGGDCIFAVPADDAYLARESSMRASLVCPLVRVLLLVVGTVACAGGAL